MIKPNLVKKVIIDKDQLFVLHKVLGSLTETPVGKYAILTNKGIILQRGCILLDGTYIENDDDLPNLNDTNGHIRQFKILFNTVLDGDYFLKNFEYNFCHILENENVHKIWKDIQNKLSNSWQGKDLVNNHKIRIHSIINLHRNSYGICLNDEKKKKLGNQGIIYVANKSHLILDTNGNKIII